MKHFPTVNTNSLKLWLFIFPQTYLASLSNGVTMMKFLLENWIIWHVFSRTSLWWRYHRLSYKLSQIICKLSKYLLVFTFAFDTLLVWKLKKKNKQLLSAILRSQNRKTLSKVEGGIPEKKKFRLTNGIDVSLVKLKTGILQRSSAGQVYLISFQIIPVD